MNTELTACICKHAGDDRNCPVHGAGVRAAQKQRVREAVGEGDLWKHRDWCDYRLDVMKGCFVCRPCDCPKDNDKR
jgi:hypothetical protein